METIENIQAELKGILSEKRYQHSIGVMKKAEELAKQYGINTHIAALTGLAHDIGKEISNVEKIKYCKDHQIEIDEIEIHNVGLLHAKIGADITKKYGFTEEMQKAILYHTTGHLDMDLLAKIVFVADKIEENREYEGVENLRKLAMQDIEKCTLVILDHTIKKNIDKGVLIHPDGIFARNQLLPLSLEK
ncbi:MAG: HD domain-containing protein [Clostridia bacterium]|jgi:predicted HD superfamily hydrolase involved in NAD metabolism|nr:HD domain-containing protein [Clostridia bacterium]MCI9413145.1 HD domain-containing protein [Clostridia bacterium]